MSTMQIPYGRSEHHNVARTLKRLQDETSHVRNQSGLLQLLRSCGESKSETKNGNVLRKHAVQCFRQNPLKLKVRNLSTNIQKKANQRRGFAGSFIANMAKQIRHRPEAADSIS